MMQILKIHEKNQYHLDRKDNVQNQSQQEAQHLGDLEALVV